MKVKSFLHLESIVAANGDIGGQAEGLLQCCLRNRHVCGEQRGQGADDSGRHQRPTGIRCRRSQGQALWQQRSHVVAQRIAGLNGVRGIARGRLQADQAAQLGNAGKSEREVSGHGCAQDLPTIDNVVHIRIKECSAGSEVAIISISCSMRFA